VVEREVTDSLPGPCRVRISAANNTESPVFPQQLNVSFDIIRNVLVPALAGQWEDIGMLGAAVNQ
jgi:hypothetical protein